MMNIRELKQKLGDSGKELIKWRIPEVKSSAVYQLR